MYLRTRVFLRHLFAVWAHSQKPWVTIKSRDPLVCLGEARPFHSCGFELTGSLIPPTSFPVLLLPWLEYLSCLGWTKSLYFMSPESLVSFTRSFLILCWHNSFVFFFLPEPLKSSWMMKKRNQYNSSCHIQTLRKGPLRWQVTHKHC